MFFTPFVASIIYLFNITRTKLRYNLLYAICIRILYLYNQGFFNLHYFFIIRLKYEYQKVPLEVSLARAFILKAAPTSSFTLHNYRLFDE